MACKYCPFRDSAEAYCYDADALEALDDGEEPACHAVVGVSAIFAHAPMDPVHPCDGYRRFHGGEPGYKKPEAAGGDA